VTQKKILVVDDDPYMRLALEVRLRASNYAVVCAGDGVAGIAETRKHLPDLIVLDIGLPAGDGFTVMERLKTNSSMMSIPVIIVSASDASVNKERALKAGATAYLQKPVKSTQLLSIVRQTLGAVKALPAVVYDLGA